MSVLIMQPGGSYTAKATIAEAAASTDAANKTVVVTSQQTVSTAIAWPADRELEFSRSGYVTLTGLGNITGLPLAKPEYFGRNTVPGTTDMTAAMESAHGTGAIVVYEARQYKFIGENLDFTAGVKVDPGTVFTNGSYNGIIQFDETTGKLIGLHHNHLEEDNASLGSNVAITSGNIVAPPLSKAATSYPVDIIAHWYNDFGLEYTRNGNGGVPGSLIWYYWNWIFKSGADYDATRHPVLGWFRGDDPNVLDWQCYWLREAGIKAVTLVPSEHDKAGEFAIDPDWTITSTWDQPTDRLYWLYQLMTNVPNFQGLQYILWGSYKGNTAQLTTKWDDLIDNVYLVYRNFYTVKMNGRLYPVIFVYEGGSLYAALGNTENDYSTFMTTMAAKFQAQGYGGLALFIRHPKGPATISYPNMERNGVLLFCCDYNGSGARTNYAGTETLPATLPNTASYETLMQTWQPYHERAEWAAGETYEEEDIVRRNGWMWIGHNYDEVNYPISGHVQTADDAPGEGKNAFRYWVKWGPVSREVVAIPTARFAVDAHDSAGNAYFLADGSTPALFRTWMRKALDSILTNPVPKILCIYSVWEWAEGGQNLSPSMGDGWAYLQAVKDALVQTVQPGCDPLIPKVDRTIRPVFLSLDTQIPSDYDEVWISTDAHRILSANPVIAAGTVGQRLRLVMVANYTLTLTDGNGVELSGASVGLGYLDSMDLVCLDGTTWVQTATNDNA